MAKRIRVTAYYEFDIIEGDGTDEAYYVDDESEADIFEALQMAHAMGVNGDEPHKPKIGFFVEKVLEDGSIKALKGVENGG